MPKLQGQEFNWILTLTVYPSTSNTPVRYLAIASANLTRHKTSKNISHEQRKKKPVKLDKTEHWWAKGLSKTVPGNQFILLNERGAKKYVFHKQGQVTFISIFL